MNKKFMNRFPWGNLCDQACFGAHEVIFTFLSDWSSNFHCNVLYHVSPLPQGRELKLNLPQGFCFTITRLWTRTPVQSQIKPVSNQPPRWTGGRRSCSRLSFRPEGSLGPSASSPLVSDATRENSMTSWAVPELTCVCRFCMCVFTVSVCEIYLHFAVTVHRHS